VPKVYTVDASVFLNAFLPREAGHAESTSLLTRLRDASAPVVVPTLLLPEVAAAIARGQSDDMLARAFAGALRRLPHLVWIPLDDALAQSAAEVAAQHRLRGSDAVYAAVALRFGSVLVTLDHEQRERLTTVLDARTPAEALADGPS